MIHPALVRMVPSDPAAAAGKPHRSVAANVTKVLVRRDRAKDVGRVRAMIPWWVVGITTLATTRVWRMSFITMIFLNMCVQ